MSVEQRGKSRAVIRCDGCGKERVTRFAAANPGDVVMQCCASAYAAGWRVPERGDKPDACPACIAREKLAAWNTGEVKR